MAQTYDEKRELLAPLGSFGLRVCEPPFPPKPQVARLWLALWPALGPEDREKLSSLPDPCLNHLEDRMRNEGRAERLTSGCLRLIGHDVDLFLEGLRLHPHSLCRAAEVLGPTPDALWERLEGGLRVQRQWKVAALISGPFSPDAFWDAVEDLALHRELPQAIMDFMETDRPRDSAPLGEFTTSLERFLVRLKLERIRFLTYAAIKDANAA